MSTINNFQFHCILTVALSPLPPSPDSSKHSTFIDIVLRMMTVQVGSSLMHRTSSTGTPLFSLLSVLRPLAPSCPVNPMPHDSKCDCYHTREGPPCSPFPIGPHRPICRSFCRIWVSIHQHYYLVVVPCPWSLTIMIHSFLGLAWPTHPVLHLWRCALGLEPSLLQRTSYCILY